MRAKKPFFAREKRALALFFGCQSLVALIISIVATLGWDGSIGLSALQGGLLAIVPALLLSSWFFLKAPQSQKILRDVYIAELLKIVLLCVMFVVMLRYGHIMILPFLAGFCGTYVVYFIAPILMK